MIKEICKDLEILSKASLPYLPGEDMSDVQDLIDTLGAHRERCVGMALNMIGVLKTAIVYVENGEIKSMVNPKIISCSKEYDAIEGCLSLEGERSCKRYQKIHVEYYTTDFKIRRKTFSGFTAEIIQHEIDHLSGIII